jgi:predicted permease
MEIAATFLFEQSYSSMSHLETLTREVRQSCRSLIRERHFTVTVILIFALCLAANVAIFAVVNGVLLKPLPFTDPHRLVLVSNSYPKAGVERAGASVPHYLERKKEIAAFAEAAAVKASGVTIGDAGSPERVESTSATPSFFRVLGATAALGRTFTEDEGVYGKHQVVVLSDGLWRERFGADPHAIGKSMRINTETFTIVGVMPPNFKYLGQTARLWTPLCFSDDDRKPQQRHSNNMEMIARLKPGVSLAEAQTQINALNEQTLKTDPYAKLVADAGFRTSVYDLGDDFVAQLRPTLLLLQAGVFFLLLIGMVNLANLFLVRATGRAKEYSVRQALGASIGQLVRSLVVESLILSVVGGVVGIAVGAAAFRSIALIGLEQLPLPASARLEPTVMAVGMGASVVLGLLLILPVIWHYVRGNPTAALSVESRGGTTTRSVHRLRHGLIVVQIALAFVLLSGTGLLGLSFIRVLAVNPGFRPENVLTAELSLPYNQYKDEKVRLAFIDKLGAELGAIPGVSAAGIGSSLPFSGGADNNAISIEGRTLAAGESLQAHFTSGVAGSYFQALGIPLREGRFLTDADSRGGNKVCVVDEEVARRYWPKGDALGHRLYNGAPPETPDKYVTVVGIVGAVKQNDLADTHNLGAVYFAYREYTSFGISLILRTVQAPTMAGPALRAAVLRTDPELALHDVKTMSTRLDQSLATRRAPVVLAGIFAAVALLLAAVGIYGVLAYTVVQRQREIGVRMALGALPAQIRAQFLGLGGRLLLLGLPIGIVGSLFAGRAMSSLLFGVSPANAPVLVGTAAVLALVAMLACLLPSRRASRVSPIEALRAT